MGTINMGNQLRIEGTYLWELIKHILSPQILWILNFLGYSENIEGTHNVLVLKIVGVQYVRCSNFMGSQNMWVLKIVGYGTNKCGYPKCG